ncbi:uncharacterized protein LOC144348403 [Saccoglossus kowalevskii]
MNCSAISCFQRCPPEYQRSSASKTPVFLRCCVVEAIDCRSIMHPGTILNCAAAVEKIENFLTLLEEENCCHKDVCDVILAWAAKNEQPRIVRLMVKQGYDTNCCDIDGNTALHIASENGSTKVVKTLLKHRTINKLKENKNKRTALHLAAGNNHIDIAYLLLGKPLPKQDDASSESEDEFGSDIEDDASSESEDGSRNYSTVPPVPLIQTSTDQGILNPVPMEVVPHAATNDVPLTDKT